MADSGRQTPRSPQSARVIRSQKIQALAPSPIAEDYPQTMALSSSAATVAPGEDRRHRDGRDRSTSSASISSTNAAATAAPMPPIIRSHTPSYLATKSHDRRRKPSELSIRQRSQSSGSVTASVAGTAAVLPPPPPSAQSGTSSHGGDNSPLNGGASGAESPAQPADGAARRPTAMRSTSAIASKPSVYGSMSSSVVLPTAARNGNATGANPATRAGARSTNGTRPGAPAAAAGAAAGGGASGSAGPVTGAAAGGGRGGGGSGSVGICAGRGPGVLGDWPPGYTAFPPLTDPHTAPDVLPAPSSGMYWSRAHMSGVPRPKIRAHTATLIGSNVYIFGGCDARACFSDLYVLDADSFHLTKPHVVGDIPIPLRAMTCTAVGKKLVVFGGGDGPDYYNDVYVLDTTNFRWSRPRLPADRPVPSCRRAHTACLYKNGIYIFGGGDGVRALNDVWRLDVSDTTKMSWKLIFPRDSAARVAERAEDSDASAGAGRRKKAGAPGSKKEAAAAHKTLASDAVAGLDHQLRPKARGYHTANMVGSRLIIFGGSDGGECFSDVWVYNVETHVWRAVTIPETYRRLSHTATIVGSYLFVVGGHDGNEYSNDVLLLNLVTMSWDKRKVYGLPPSGRGYHSTILYDSRLIVIGGFDGGTVFGDVWTLELAVHAYYSQISHFSIDV